MSVNTNTRYLAIRLNELNSLFQILIKEGGIEVRKRVFQNIQNSKAYDAPSKLTFGSLLMSVHITLFMELLYVLKVRQSRKQILLS